MIPYFIASLPRSRTAWLANFLTYGISFCFHEPLSTSVITDYPDMMRGVGTAYVGISDSLNSIIMTQLIDLFPEAKIVVIRREISEVFKSLRKIRLIVKMEVLEKINRELDRIEQVYDPLIIEYDDFDCPRIWHYLFGGSIPFPVRRYQMLETFNVTVPAEILLIKGAQFLALRGITLDSLERTG